MVSSSSNCSVTCCPRCTLRRFLCSMTRARKALRSRAYASSDSRLSRRIGITGRRAPGSAAAGNRTACALRMRRVDALRPPRARAAIGLQVAMQLDQRLAVDLALEVDHRVERDPVVVPAPGIELGVAARAQLDVAVPAHQAQQIPDLLLPAVGGAITFARAAQPFLGHLVAQPFARAPEDAHVAALQADFLFQLAVHRLERRLAVLDATLRELPRVLVDPLAPEHVVPAIGENDADVRTVAFLVEHGPHRLK